MQYSAVRRYQNLSCRTAHRTLLAVLLSFILLVCSVHAQTITGKVVGVADGDTITVLQDRTQYKIRLYGIDCPESGQDFGNRAKQFVSGMVYGKQVQVIQKDMDRYGRVVGMVYVGNTCVNEEIVRAGLAWVYHRYCKDSFCQEWADLRPRQGLQR
jgi:micrococcal nuclease